MKFLVLFLVFVSVGFSSVIKSKLISVDLEQSIATIEISKIDIGMSGFVSHKLSNNHSAILNNVVVIDFDKEKHIATLKLSKFDDLVHTALPQGKWKTRVGDTVTLAFGYTRGLLIAPSEEIYYYITRATSQMQWVHPDIFATILSFQGHPTPLKDDFTRLSKATSVGLLFLYLNKYVFTIDIKSFVILNISPAPLTQDNIILPFYTRVEEIDASWWGEGSDELQAYEPYYFSLLVKYNQKNKELFKIIEENGSDNIQYLLEKFNIKD